MATAKLKAPLDLISGTIGDFTYVALHGVQVIRRKARPAKRSARQGLQPMRIKGAAEYWRRIKGDPEKRSLYEALPRVPGVGLYQLAVRDYCNPPVITVIDVSSYSGKASEKIRIGATDDTKVVEVTVEIADMDGGLVEEGRAQFDKPTGVWVYTANKAVTSGQTVTVRATAMDLPGNRASKGELAYVR